MSDNIKLIIEIPKIDKELLDTGLCGEMRKEAILYAVKNATPLDSVKAEIEKKCNRINSIASVLRYPQHREIQELLCEILASIDNAESEVKPNDSMGTMV